LKKDLNILAEESSHYEKLANRTVKNFTRKGINAFFAPNSQEACSMVMGMIPEGAVIGMADSLTLLQVGVISALNRRQKNEILNPFVRDDDGKLVVDGEPRQEIMRKVFLSDVYVIGTNAVTLDGKLVNIDAHGNRVAAMIFGPKKVIVVVGANKIVKNVDEAIDRIKEVCAPINATRHGLKHHRPEFLELPCAKTGSCDDCNHTWRICRFTTIIEGVNPSRKDYLNVVIVGERLGI
jgi:L-lactate utilization protein LutB